MRTTAGWSPAPQPGCSGRRMGARPPIGQWAHPQSSGSDTSNRNRRNNEARVPQGAASMTGVQPVASAPRTPSHGQKQQDAHRCHPPRGDPGGGAPQRPGRGVRLRIGRAQAAARQHLSGEGDARRAVAAGGLRRLRRQPPRLPGLQRNPSRLLPDPGRRPAGAAGRGGRSGSRGRGRSRRPRGSRGSRRSRTTGRRHGQGRYRGAPRDDQPDEPPEGQEALPRGCRPRRAPARAGICARARSRSAVMPQRAASQSSGDAAPSRPWRRRANGNGEAASEAGGNGHVEDIGSDQAEAPETVSTVEQVGSEDALEEVPERPRRRMRSYKIQEVIKRRQIILVQVVKEERGSKGAALTTYLSLAGRYTVLMPNTGRGGGISRKITQPQDRKRLKAIAQELEVPEGMGLIIRTAGAARTKQEIKRDFEYEIRLWENVRDLTLHVDGALPRLRGRQPHQALDPRPLLQGHRRDPGGRRGGLQGSLRLHGHAVAQPGQERHQVRGARAAVCPLPDRAPAERDVQPLRHAAVGRLSRHQPDRGAGLHRRQLRQGDARVLHRGDRAQHQPRGVRRDRPAAQAAETSPA